MATYCLSNFVKNPSISDNLMYIYNCSNVLTSMIDPYTTVFYYKGKYVNIVTDGKMNYNNVLDFSSESEAISAVARLNDVKKIFIDRINQAIQHDASDPLRAKFVEAGKFGLSSSAASGAVTVTLQTTYNNSTQPEIIIDDVKNAVDFRIGTSSDADKLVTFQNSIGTENAWITGEGDAYFRNITGNTCFTNTIELLSGSESQFIMKDSVNGNRYKIILSGGTFNIQPI
ncbi:hypothetical protein M0Q97_07920 [Candidatus Dojkabacteria bacterium]|nr:hypothetical protein [Candidatus Dojkabacteria bacterium]